SLTSGPACASIERSISRLSRLSSTMTMRRGVGADSTSTVRSAASGGVIWGSSTATVLPRPEPALPPGRPARLGGRAWGQLHGDGPAAPGPRALRGDPAAVELDEPTHQGQPDAQPTLRPVERPLALVEQVEDPVDHLRGHAHAVVLHREPTPAAIPSDRDQDAAATRGVLDRSRG